MWKCLMDYARICTLDQTIGPLIPEFIASLSDIIAVDLYFFDSLIQYSMLHTMTIICSARLSALSIIRIFDIRGSF